MFEESVSLYRAPNGAAVVRLHYSADPAKDTRRVDGVRWVAETSSAYPSGIRGAEWRQEYEIDWYLHGKSPVFPDWDERYVPAVVIPPFSVPSSWPVYVGYDYGYREFASASFIAFKDRESLVKIQEIYLRETPPQEFAELMKASPYWPQVRYVVGDPSIWTTTQHTTINGKTQSYSIGKIFRDCGITIRQGRNEPGVDIAYKDLLIGNLWRYPKPGKIKYRIVSTCVNTIAEYRAVQFKDHVSKNKAESSDLPEVIASKKVHAWDSDKYVILSRPMALPRRDEEPPADSIAALRAEFKRRRERSRLIIR